MILITKCYSEVTPESAELGELSDSGVDFEDAPFGFRELVDYMQSNGFVECSISPCSGSTCEWVSTGYSIDDYRTMTEIEYSLHYSNKNPQRNAKYWRMALKAAGIIK